MEEVKQQLTQAELDASNNELEKQDKAEADTKVVTLNQLKNEGAQVPNLTKDQILTLVSQDFIEGLRILDENWKKLSKKGSKRVMISILQLQEENMKSYLQNDLERGLFQVGQKVLAARSTLLYNKIVEDRAEQLKKDREEKEQQDKTKENINVNSNSNEQQQGQQQNPPQAGSSLEQNGQAE